MDPLFPASNAQDYANAYTSGFDPSESGGTSTRTTPTMSADLGGFDASAACDNGGDAYSLRAAYYGAPWTAHNESLNARVPVPPSPPPSFDPEHPFADLDPAMRNHTFKLDATYGNGSFDGGAMNLSLVPPQVGIVPPYALAHAPVPNHNVNNPFHAMYPGMQHPGVGGQMAVPNPSYPVYQAPLHPPAFGAFSERSHMGYPIFASPNLYLPAPPVDMSAQHTTAVDEFLHVPYEHEHHDNDAGSVGVQVPLAQAADVEAPPARGRKGKAKNPTAKAKASRARKEKAIDPPAASVAGSSRLVDDGAQGWRDLDAPDSIPSFLALQNANIGVQHAPLALSVEGAYPGGDVQVTNNNHLTRGQSRGSSAGSRNGGASTVASSPSPITWTGGGASKDDQVRDDDGRLAVHALIPEVERQPPVPGKGVIVCKPPPKGKDVYCHQCWLAERVVYWQDIDGLRKHNRTKHSTERGDNSVPHMCILECGWSKRSTQATHFVEHRLRHCPRYRELKKDGGRALEEFLTERKLHGHWQLKGKRKA